VGQVDAGMQVASATAGAELTRHGPLARLRAAAAKRTAAGVRRSVVPRSAGFGSGAGAGGGPGALLDLASNDYLGLCGDPRLTEAAVAAAREWGTGSTGSRLVTGSTELHARLEAALARFGGAERALVFSSGYLANLSVVTALAAALGSTGGGEAGEGGARVGGGVLIVADARNHASLIDACRLARGPGVRLAIAPHGDAAAVASLLATRTEESALVVSDAVFSVDGTIAPVAALHAAAVQHGAMLVLDEAHAFGVLGPGGRGCSYEGGIAGLPEVVRTVTLSKSLASQGGAVLGAAEVIETVIDTGRGFIFDTGLAPPSAGAALAALEVLAAEPALGARAMAHAQRLAAIAASLGLRVVAPQAAVVAITLGDPARAVRARDICAQSGVRAGCFRPPSVPEGAACLRLTARACLTQRDFDVASRALTSVRDHVGVDVSPPFRQ
jgi:8-amino-7-oxononanoate synthase